MISKYEIVSLIEYNFAHFLLVLSHLNIELIARHAMQNYILKNAKTDKTTQKVDFCTRINLMQSELGQYKILNAVKVLSLFLFKLI